jgi:hypothetical protein
VSCEWTGQLKFNVTYLRISAAMGQDTATNVLLLLLMIMMIVGSDGIVDIKWIEALISNDALIANGLEILPI